MRTTYIQNVLISGAGIAGPALAYWLLKAGVRVTVVERYPALRRGGQAVDFRGPVHRAVLDRMGVWDAIWAERTKLDEHALYDVRGKTVTRLPAMMMSGDVEILRGDLSRILYDRTQGADYRFGDAIASIDDGGDRGGRVDVGFESGARDSFDLVIGADGLHSGTRALAFGPHERFLKHYGYRVAGCTIPNVLRLDRRGFTYSVPGRGVTITASRDPAEARALFTWAVPKREAGDARASDARASEPRAAVAAAFAGVGWEVPRLVAELQRAPDLYHDTISTVHVDGFARGRVALLGDAAWGGTLGGQGTSCAIVGAYVLAGELLANAPADGLRRYEDIMRPYVTKCQKGAMHVGGFLAPRSRLALFARNTIYRWLASRPMEKLFAKLVTGAAENLALPTYAAAA